MVPKQIDKFVPRKRPSSSAGNILSRGLTINGLSGHVFGRTAGFETMDTVLQRGRWFGHKMKEADLISIHLQDEPGKCSGRLRKLTNTSAANQIVTSQRLNAASGLARVASQSFLCPNQQGKEQFPCAKQRDLVSQVSVRFWISLRLKSPTSSTTRPSLMN